MKYTIERSFFSNDIVAYVTEVDNKEIRIDRFSSRSERGISFNEVSYSVFVSDLMTESRSFSKLSDAKKFVAELVGA
jgi:hypothetical protein